jgi:hypothetical protein
MMSLGTVRILRYRTAVGGLTSSSAPIEVEGEAVRGAESDEITTLWRD